MKQLLGRALGSFLFILTLVLSSTTFAASPIDTGLAPMLQRILPTIVNIRAIIKINDFATLRDLQRERRIGPLRPGQQLSDTFTSLGSGVIVDSKHGYIITNAHVVSDATKITITLSDGRHFQAKVIGSDRPSDIALLQIKVKDLPAIKIGDSNTLKVGDFVAAIGSPFGLSQSVTSGIISALGRNTLGIENYENFIQTDAPINPGSSGGALVNVNGELIGINTAILAPALGNIGIGFAIPTSMVKSIMDQLIKFGDVKRGLLGIGSQDITPDLAQAFNVKTDKGAAVTQILPDSPAQKAGIEVGDIIKKVNGTDIKNAGDVVNTVGFLRVNTKVNIDLLRKDKPVTISAELTDPKARKEIIEKDDPFLFGVGMGNFAQLSPIHGNVQGVAVMSIEEDSNAWAADLRPGDVITSANQTPVHNIMELKAIVAKADKTVLLNVLRGASAVFLVIDKQP